MNEEKMLGWYRNFVRFSDKYFPHESFGVIDKAHLFRITRDVNNTLGRDKRITGTDLLRAVSDSMRGLGYNVRSVK